MTRKCIHCRQEVVKRRWFWVLPDEMEETLVTACPVAGIVNHEVDEEEG